MKENLNAIAVFRDDNDQLARFDEMTHWVVYTKEETVWRKSDRVPFQPVLSGEIATIRENINKMIEDFKTCKIIIAKSLTGIPYQIFDKSGFIICESEAFDLDLLEAIQKDLIRNTHDENNNKDLVPPAPGETDQSGYYFLDLTQLKQKHPEMSSKMVLLPFLKNTPFYSLDLVCDHIPPWFDQKLEEMKLAYTIQNNTTQDRNDHTTYVVITHRDCEHRRL